MTSFLKANFLLTVAVLCFPSLALSTDEINLSFSSPSFLSLKKQTSVPTNKQGQVMAETRLNLLKEIITQFPDLTVNTKVPSSDTLWPLYETDLAFIKGSMQNRSNKKAIIEALDYLDSKVRGFGWNEQMCLTDLNLIGLLWVQILSTSDESLINAFEKNDVIDRSQETKDYFLKYLTTDYMDEAFICYLNNSIFSSTNYIKQIQDSHNLYLPHVSPTGSLPLAILRKAWGFYGNSNKEKAYHLNFAAVATNPTVNFDYAIELPPIDSWSHDLIHASKYDPYFQDLSEKIALGTAKLFEEIEKNYNSFETLHSIHIAFFHLFHEKPRPVLELVDLAEFQAKKIKGIITKIDEKTDITDSFFNSEQQFKVLVGSTERILKKSLKGETLLEKYKSYLELYLEGLSILEKYGNIYDVITK